MAHAESFLKEQAAHLHAEKQRLEEELQRIAKNNPTVPGDYDAVSPDYGRDPESNAQEEETYETRIGVEHSLEQHLQEVNAALSHIEQGTYGVCAVCGQTIDADRLKAFPAAASCVNHAEK